MKHFLKLLYFLPLLVHGQASVLSRGTWLKMGITQAGVYKLDAAFFQRAGISLLGVNPQNIKIYGYAGGMLPQPNDAPRPTDLPENAISIEGENDGTFDTQDYVLFYAEGPHTVQYNAVSKQFSHQTNLYSDTAFYYLNIADTKGLRIQNRTSIRGKKDIRSYEDYIFRELETNNILRSGREWFSEQFVSNQEQTFNFNLSGLVASSSVRVRISALSNAANSSFFSIKINDQTAGNLNFNGNGQDRYDIKGRITEQTFAQTANPTANSIKVGLSYGLSGGSGVGHLNFIGIQATRSLRVYQNPTFFQFTDSIDSAQFQVENFTQGLRIWDISQRFSPKNQDFILANQVATFGIGSSSKGLWGVPQMIVFDAQNLVSPTVFQKISNQNIRALATPELLIVVSEKLRPEAMRLADFRRSNDKLKVEVVTTAQIFHEFSSGRTDPSAIRDFVKYLYDRNPETLKYLLIFGDASFDTKRRTNVDAFAHDTYVPTYESRESLNPIYSYSSDDYFGFLQNNEGQWNEDFAGDHSLDIGIGRLPVRTLDEAKSTVNKLIRYVDSPQNMGNWREKVVFIADNGDRNIHSNDAESIAQLAQRFRPSIQLEKLYVDAFPQVITANGRTAPKVNEALDRAIREGALIINFSGHGSPDGWTDEKVLTIGQIQGWSNFNQMPLFLTATCEFGRFDDPNQLSGAELALLNPQGGGIGLLTTTRPVFSSTNFLLNGAFYRNVFLKVEGKPQRLGEVFRKTKNESLVGSINRNFTLLGDPSMILAYPRDEISLTRINGRTLTGNDTLKALQKITLEGKISDPNYNGLLTIAVYDKEKQITTPGDGIPFNYQAFANKLFEGKASIRNGTFTSSFVVPKDIDYRVGRGRIYLYAIKADSSASASGAYSPLIGSSSAFVADNQPPKVSVYLNNEDFKNGDSITDQQPLFLAKVSDDNGLNISPIGLGHEMLLTIDDTLQIVVNEYFEAQKDDFSKGTIRFRMPKLSIGEHNLRIKLWDTHNNASESTLNFRVIIGQKITDLSNVTVFPNPFDGDVTFRFGNERQGDDLELKLQVFDESGRLVQELTQINYQADAATQEIVWSGVSNLSLAPKTYIYRLGVRSLSAQYQAQKTGKILKK
jgi:hypothetical protein